MRYELIVIDEMAYVAIPESAAELLFQVIAGRAERAAVIITTNLVFSEWTSLFPNARLCKALVDRPGAHHRHGKGLLSFPADFGEKERGQAMSQKQWYQAPIRWAELVEGPQGLRGWQEASYFFLSETATQAFQQALAAAGIFWHLRGWGMALLQPVQLGDLYWRCPQHGLATSGADG